jgi:hypothetical protein
MHAVSDARPDRLVDAPLTMKWSVFLAAVGAVVFLCLLILRPFWGASLGRRCLRLRAIRSISG